MLKRWREGRLVVPSEELYSRERRAADGGGGVDEWTRSVDNREVGEI